MSKVNEIRPYEVLFEELLLTTIDKFKNATINVVQQQHPMCLIENLENGSIYWRVSIEEITNIDHYCVSLASIYKAQEDVIKNIENSNINLIKMYLDNPIPDGGFYDGVHTNSIGAISIANYLKTKLKF